jgi:hypothetical protein
VVEPDGGDGPPEQRKPRLTASHLLGWHLDRAVLDFLQATGAVLDVDEYDMTLGRAAATAGPGWRGLHKIAAGRWAEG